MRKLKPALIALLSLALLYLAFRGTDFKQIISIISGVKYQYILLAIMIDLLYFAVKTIKWRYIFVPVKRISFISFFKGIAVGSMSNNLLPFRLDELVRTFYFGWKGGVSKAIVLGTIVIERLVDIFTMLLATGALFLLFHGNQWIEKSSMAILSFFVFMVCVVFILIRYGERMSARAEKCYPEVGKKITDRFVDLYTGFLAGLKVFPRRGRLIFVLLFSWSEWLITILYLKMFLLAFSIEIPLKGYLLLVAASYVSISIPSVPSSIGVFEFLVKSSLVTAFAIDPNTAISFTLMLHFFMVAPISLLGIAILFKDGISISQLRRLKAENQYIPSMGKG